LSKKQLSDDIYQMTTILQAEHPVLRKVADPVQPKDFGSAHLARIIKSMKEALDSQDDGVAIAAPQIGSSLRIFIVSKKAFRRGRNADMHAEDLVCINPEITKLSKEKKLVPEGCLSVRYLYGKIERSTKATLRAQNERGEIFTRGASGLLAQIFQHEVDHLEGKLFIDRAVDVEDLPPEHIKGHKEKL
jgi:peptide deformylase